MKVKMAYQVNDGDIIEKDNCTVKLNLAPTVNAMRNLGLVSLLAGDDDRTLACSFMKAFDAPRPGFINNQMTLVGYNSAQVEYPEFVNGLNRNNGFVLAADLDMARPYSGSDDRRGTINTKESWIKYNTATSYTNKIEAHLVVDFPTHAGNGTIDTFTMNDGLIFNSSQHSYHMKSRRSHCVDYVIDSLHMPVYKNSSAANVDWLFGQRNGTCLYIAIDTSSDTLHFTYVENNKVYRLSDKVYDIFDKLGSSTNSNFYEMRCIWKFDHETMHLVATHYISSTSYRFAHKIKLIPQNNGSLAYETIESVTDGSLLPHNGSYSFTDIVTKQPTSFNIVTSGNSAHFQRWNNLWVVLANCAFGNYTAPYIAFLDAEYNIIAGANLMNVTGSYNTRHYCYSVATELSNGDLLIRTTNAGYCIVKRDLTSITQTHMSTITDNSAISNGFIVVPPTNYKEEHRVGLALLGTATRKKPLIEIKLEEPLNKTNVETLKLIFDLDISIE